MTGPGSRPRRLGRALELAALPAAVAEGLWCAIRVPFWLRGSRLRSLMAPPGTMPAEGSGRPASRRDRSGASSGDRSRFEHARRSARHALRLLSRIPASPWRSTCLYESVAACLLGRRHGRATTLALGVRAGGAGRTGDPVEAHAWVMGDETGARGGAGRPARRDSVVDPSARSPRTFRRLSPARERVRMKPLRRSDLTLTVDRDLRPLLDLWLPTPREESGERTGPRAPGVVLRIHARDAPAGSGPGTGERPTFRVGTVGAWVGGSGGRAVARGSRHGFLARLDLSAGAGDVYLTDGAREFAREVGGGRPGPLADELRREPDHPAWEAASVLSASAVLLLGRTGRTLLHAGAAAPPARGAWLLVGDGRSGKSSACAGLVAAGWDYLSDDQLLVAPGPGRPVVEGWSRGLNLDEGWSTGAPTGERRSTRAETLGGGGWRPEAPVDGVLLTRVRPDRPTSVESASPGECLSELIRQSPWLLTDRAVSERLLSSLTEIAERPAYRVSLGRDAFGDAGPLLRALEETGIGPAGP